MSNAFRYDIQKSHQPAGIGRSMEDSSATDECSRNHMSLFDPAKCNYLGIELRTFHDARIVANVIFREAIQRSTQDYAMTRFCVCCRIPVVIADMVEFLLVLSYAYRSCGLYLLHKCTIYFVTPAP